MQPRRKQRRKFWFLVHTLIEAVFYHVWFTVRASTIMSQVSAARWSSEVAGNPQFATWSFAFITDPRPEVEVEVEGD